MPPDADDRLDEEDDLPRRRGGRGMWSGTITFGLVSVPVSLLPAVRSEKIRLRMLDESGVPLRRRYYCPAENVEVHPEHLIRGYPIEKDKYIIVREDELEALEPEKSRDIDLRRFVDLRAIEPLYFDRPYYLVPDGESTKAYRLLAQVMERKKKAGVATFVMRDKEYLVAIIAERGILRAETMRFHDEIRDPDAVGLDETGEPETKLTEKFTKAIRSLTKSDIARSELRDEHTEALRKLIERKARAGEDLVEVQSLMNGEGEEGAGAEEEGESGAGREDLMTLLKRSLDVDETSPRSKRAARGNGHVRPSPPTRRKTTKRNAGRADSDQRRRSTGAARSGTRSRSRSGAPREGGGARSLEALSRDELYKRAQKLEIPNRSRMSKDDLINALRRRHD